MNDLFVEIEDGFFLEANSIKFIVDYARKNNKFQALLSRCKKNDKLREEALDKKEALREKGIEDNTPILYRKKYFTHACKTSDGTYRYIVTRNNELHSTSLSLAELKQRCFNAGVKLVDMSELSSVALSYISGIDDVSQDFVSSSRKAWSSETAILQFVSGNSNKINTVLWLKTSELVKVSKESSEILEQIKALNVDWDYFKLAI